MRIAIEIYRDIDHALSPDDRPGEARWNVILYEIDERDEPNLEGWESQPFGDRRFSFEVARRLADQLQIRFSRQRHKVKRFTVASALDAEVSSGYPRHGKVYRWTGPTGCVSQDFRDS